MESLAVMIRLHAIERDLRMLKASYKLAFENDEEFEIVKVILKSIRQLENEISIMVIQGSPTHE